MCPLCHAEFAAPSPGSAEADGSIRCPSCQRRFMQLSAHAGGNGPKGIACRKCGCSDFRVHWVDQRDGFTRRSKICRNCGERVITTERPQGS